MEIFDQLNRKFSGNFKESVEYYPEILSEAEIKAKSIYSLGEILNKNASNKTHKEVSIIFNEVFSDITLSIYLSACCMHNASKVLLRRVLELGIATIYFWDLPHKYWGWKNFETYESDLSFKDNIEHLSSSTYSLLLKSEFDIRVWEIEKDKINKVYRSLSNTIHGKYLTLETLSNTSFEFDKEEYKSNLKTIIQSENILISCFKQRFKSEFVELSQHIPALERFNYGY